MAQKLSPTRKKQIQARSSVARRPIKPAHPDLLAASYAKDLEAEIARGFKLVQKFLFPVLRDDTDMPDKIQRADIADDADLINTVIDGILERYFGGMFSKSVPNTVKYSRKVADKLVEPMQKQADRFNKTQFTKQFKRISGVDPLQFEPGLNDFLEVAGDQNVNLIVTQNSKYFDDIRQMANQALRDGTSVAELRDAIIALTDTTKQRAQLIAIDQVQKLNADLESQRQQNNGIRRYIWRTRRNARVRSKSNSSGYSDHAGLEGAVIDYGFPPITVLKGKRANERNHAGKDINCFPAGTLIDTPSGKIAIEDIRPGNIVYSHGGEKEVVGLHNSRHKGKLIGIKLFHKTIWLTPNHKVFVRGRIGGFWKDARTLKLTDQIVEFKEIFPGGVFNKDTARNIKHPHPHLLREKLVTDWVNMEHAGLNLNNCIEFFKEKISGIINPVDLIRFLKLPLSLIFNTKNIKPSRAHNLRLWDKSVSSIGDACPHVGRAMIFSPFGIIDPLKFNSFASSALLNPVMGETFPGKTTTHSSFLSNSFKSPQPFDIMRLKPFFKCLLGFQSWKRTIDFYLDSFNVAQKRAFIRAFFRTISCFADLNDFWLSKKFFVANFAKTLNRHKTSFNRVNNYNKSTHHHYVIVDLISQDYNGQVYNFEVKDSMSYFAEGVLVANCKCWYEPVIEDLTGETSKVLEEAEAKTQQLIVDGRIPGYTLPKKKKTEAA